MHMRVRWFSVVVLQYALGAEVPRNSFNLIEVQLGGKYTTVPTRGYEVADDIASGNEPDSFTTRKKRKFNHTNCSRSTSSSAESAAAAAAALAAAVTLSPQQMFDQSTAQRDCRMCSDVTSMMQTRTDGCSAVADRSNRYSGDCSPRQQISPVLTK